MLRSWIEIICTQIKRVASVAVRDKVAEANRHIGASRWSEASAALLTVSGPIGFQELERKVREAQETLDTRRNAGRRDKKKSDERADVGQIARMRAGILTACAERRYASAARTFRGDVWRLKTESAEQLAKIRVRRLQGASACVQLLAKHWPTSGIKLELEFQSVGAQLGKATAVDPRGRRFSFVYGPYLSSVNIDEFEPKQLLGFFDAVPLSATQRIDLARLGFELGQDMWATQVLVKLRGLHPSLKAEIDDLMVLAEAR